MRKRRVAVFAVLALGAFILVAPGTAPTDVPDQVRNLRAFAKLYGYVRWFHPADEAARVDWDAFAVYGAGRLKNARNPRELKATLEELFQPIAPSAAVVGASETPVVPKDLMPKDYSGLKPVAWQHLGMGTGVANSAYFSVRTNRENRVDVVNSQGAANLLQALDVKSRRGEEIRLRAFVRAAVKELGDGAQLWLRVDRDNGLPGFFDNMADRPIRNPEWKEYEILGKIDADAVRAVFGCLLIGRSQVWLDDLRIWTRKQGENWKILDVSNGGFEEGEINGKPRQWMCQPPMYDYRVVGEGVRKGKACFSMKPFEQLIADRLFDKIPQSGEAIHKPLDQGLSCLIPLMLSSDGKNTLPRADAVAVRKLMNALEKIGSRTLSADNEDVRLGDVVVAWNVFQHFYPYFDVVKVDWDKALTDTLTAALSDKNEKDFLRTLSRMVAQIGDGHGIVWHPLLMKEAGLPFRLGWIENQAVITASQDEARFRRGDVLLSLDGKSAELAVKELEDLISGSPQHKRNRAMLQLGYSGEGTTASLKIKRGESIINIAGLRTVKTPVRAPARPNIDQLGNGVYYVSLMNATWEEIKARIEELAAARGVVFDLRGYPNGNHQLISHLLVQPDTSSAWMKIPQIIYPDRENVVGFKEFGWLMPVSKPHIKGKVVFLTDASAISYSESFLGFVESCKLGEIVGEPTAGANGNVNWIKLAGGFTINWTGMKVVKHDGSQQHLIGIRPTVAVPRTIQGVKNGRDEFLEKALAIIRQGK